MFWDYRYLLLKLNLTICCSTVGVLSNDLKQGCCGDKLKDVHKVLGNDKLFILSISLCLHSMCIFVCAYMYKHTCRVNIAFLQLYLILFLIFLSSKSLCASLSFPGNYMDSWANSYYITYKGKEKMKETAIMHGSG